MACVVGMRRFASTVGFEASGAAQHRTVPVMRSCAGVAGPGRRTRHAHIQGFCLPSAAALQSAPW